MSRRYSKKKCAKCEQAGFRFRGDRWLCVVHNRFDTMANIARKRGKQIPTHDEFAAMAASVMADGMKCPHCRITMEWHGDRHSATVSLQHDRNGEMRFMCMGCNCRHRNFPGDTFYDYPPNWRFCKLCNTAKPPTDFYNPMASGRPQAYCRTCKRDVGRESYATVKSRLVGIRTPSKET